MFSQIPSRRGHRADAGARILTEKEAEHAPVAGREFDEDAEWGGEEGILGDSQATWSGDPANFATAHGLSAPSTTRPRSSLKKLMIDATQFIFGR